MHSIADSSPAVNDLIIKFQVRHIVETVGHGGCARRVSFIACVAASCDGRVGFAKVLGSHACPAQPTSQLRGVDEQEALDTVGSRSVGLVHVLWACNGIVL